MKKKRIVVVNRGKRPLHLLCRKCRIPSKDKYMVKKRKVLKLQPGTYNMQLFYTDRAVLLESSLNGNLEVEDVVSPLDNRFMGKHIVLPESIHKVKITCREQFSVASILEGN